MPLAHTLIQLHCKRYVAVYLNTANHDDDSFCQFKLYWFPLSHRTIYSITLLCLEELHHLIPGVFSRWINNLALSVNGVKSYRIKDGTKYTEYSLFCQALYHILSLELLFCIFDFIMRLKLYLNYFWTL